MKKFGKILAVMTAVVMTAGVLTSCVIKNTNPAVRVGDTDMPADEFAYYVYIQKSQSLQEAGVSTSDESAAKAYWNEKTDGKKNIDIAVDKAVDEAAKLLVRYNKALEMGVEFTADDESQLASQIESMKQQAGGEAAYQNQLKSLGTTPTAFESLYKKNMIVNKLTDKLAEDGTIAVTDDEVKDYIKNNYIKAEHILFLTQDSNTGEAFDDETIAQKKQTAEDTLTKIKNGANFEELMNELSEDTGLASYPDGYEFTKGQMVPQFEEAAFALGENEVSGIVETSYGYHIIKRLPFEITDEKINEYKDDAKQACQSEKFDKLTDEWNTQTEVKSFKSILKTFKK